MGGERILITRFAVVFSRKPTTPYLYHDSFDTSPARSMKKRNSIPPGKICDLAKGFERRFCFDAWGIDEH